MQQFDIKTLLEAWSKKEKIKIEEERKRRYLHFDSSIKSVSARLIKEISNPDYVVRRFFYPFIQDSQIIRKYKYDEGEKYVGIKKRPICYASHKDAFIFSWYAYILNHLYILKIKKLGISENVIAYRSDLRKNNVHFAKEVFTFIKRKGDCAVLCFDIVKFFDTLDHKILKSAWRGLLLDANLLTDGNLPKDHYAVYKAATRFSFASKNNLFKFFKIDKKSTIKHNKICELEDFKKIVRTVGLIQKNKSKGVPQGIAVSSVLSNAYMIEFDVNVSHYVTAFNGLYRRYCDDIIVVCERQNYQLVEKFIVDQIEKLKLEIQKDKTEIRLFSVDNAKLNCVDENGKVSKLQYLGIQTDGVIESLRGKTVAKYHRRVTGSVKHELVILKKSKNSLARKRINKKFIHSKNRSFIAYAKMAIDTLNSSELKKQFSVRNLSKIIRRKINKYSKPIK